MKKLFYILSLVVTMGLTACGGDDEPKSKFKDVTLTYEETYSIPNGKGITWKSSNGLVASVSEDVVTAEHVGEATISSDKGTFKVTVKPSFNTYKEPCMSWGATNSAVKSFMKGYYSGLSIYTDDSSTLAYSANVTQKVMLVLYTFENNKMTSSGLTLNSDYVDSDDLVDFLVERYVPYAIDSDNYRFYFINPESTMTVLMQLSVVGSQVVYIIAYAPINSSSKSPIEFNLPFDKILDLNPESGVDLNAKFEEIQNKLR